MNEIGIFSFILLYRVINALIVETQFDPDEYWQTLEPAYCLAFQSNCAYTWEWTRRRNVDSINLTNIDLIEEALHGPVRSYVPILPIYALYKLLRAFHLDTTWSIARAPLILNAALVAAPTDFGVFYMSRYIRRIKKIRKNEFSWKFEHWALLASITNWFNGYALVRTYSNSTEAALLCVGMTLLCPELFGIIHSKHEFKVRLMARLAFLLGGISIVIRFTALASWVPIGIIICLRRKSMSSRIYYLWHMSIVSGAMGVFLGCILDRIYYGFWAIPFLGSFHFNVLLGNGSLYGTHPWFWYIVAGLPAIAGILTPLFIHQCFSCFREDSKSRTLDNPLRILLIIIVIYIGFHSISAHKEFRFILPILSLVSILVGYALASIYTREPSCASYRRQRFAFLVSMLVLLNIPHLLYLCIVHQRAPIQVNKTISILLDEIQRRGANPMTVHYLMGCHSTPLYSHLHISGRHKDIVPFEVWHLDCSPKCRSDPHSQCESERFTTDPLGFIEDAYRHNEVGYCSSSEDKNCEIHDSGAYLIHREVPDVLVIFEEDLNKSNSADLKDLLVSIGLKKSKSIRHTIKELSIVKKEVDAADDDEELVFRIPGVGIGLKLEFEHMVIFTPLDHSLH